MKHFIIVDYNHSSNDAISLIKPFHTLSLISYRDEYNDKLVTNDVYSPSRAVAINVSTQQNANIIIGK